MQSSDGGNEVIDIVCGMQYGDEGKGASAAMLHVENAYYWTARTGGSQAEHRFRYRGQPYRMRVLPCAAAIDPTIKAYITAGMVIRPDILHDEVTKYAPQNLIIDRNACISRPIDKLQSQHDENFVTRGGYGMGISTALCKKIRREDRSIIAQEYYGTANVVNDHIFNHVWHKEHGLIEASQGALLSLNHGDYPYVTSYDVTAPAVMAAAGVGHRYIRHIYGIVRAFPMRVAGNSGPMLGGEIDWETIEKEKGITISDYRKNQTNEDNSTYGRERIARFSPEEFRRAVILNTPDSMIQPGGIPASSHPQHPGQHHPDSCRLVHG